MALKSCSVVNDEPYKNDDRSVSFKAFLNAFVEVRLRIASGSEFQQSTDLYRKYESKWLVADLGFWIKGVEWREEARGK